MAAFGGLFGKKQEEAFARITRFVHDRFGCKIASPSPEILAQLNALKPGEFTSFESIQSLHGLEAWFRAKSIQALVNQDLHMIALIALPSDELPARSEPAARHTATISTFQRQEIKLDQQPAATVAQQPPAASSVSEGGGAELLGLSTAGFENLDSFERLCPALVDLFIRQGQLLPPDKEVLKKIQPIDSSLEARVAALERWQTELARRCRSMSVPKVNQSLGLGDSEAGGQETDLQRRFAKLLGWLGKLIKAFEATGVRYPAKPVWLPR